MDENVTLKNLFKNIVQENTNIVEQILIRAKQSQYIILGVMCFLTVVVIVNSDFKNKQSRKLHSICIFMCFTQIVVTLFALNLSQNSTETIQ